MTKSVPARRRRAKPPVHPTIAQMLRTARRLELDAARIPENPDDLDVQTVTIIGFAVRWTLWLRARALDGEGRLALCVTTPATHNAPYARLVPG